MKTLLEKALSKTPTLDYHSISQTTGVTDQKTYISTEDVEEGQLEFDPNELPDFKDLFGMSEDKLMEIAESEFEDAHGNINSA